jgi:hypothetical protein
MAEADEGCCGSGVAAFEIARKASVSADPRQSPFNDSAFWQDHEGMSVGSLDDFNLPGCRGRDGLFYFRSLTTSVGEDRFDERETLPRLPQHIARSVA